MKEIHTTETGPRAPHANSLEEHFGIGDTLVDLRTQEAALSHVFDSLDLNPNDAEGMSEYAWRVRGEKDVAEESLAKFISTNKDELGKQGIETREQLVASAPDTAEVRRYENTTAVMGELSDADEKLKEKLSEFGITISNSGHFYAEAKDKASRKLEALREAIAEKERHLPEVEALLPDLPAMLAKSGEWGQKTLLVGGLDVVYGRHGDNPSVSVQRNQNAFNEDLSFVMQNTTRFDGLKKISGEEQATHILMRAFERKAGDVLAKSELPVGALALMRKKVGQLVEAKLLAEGLREHASEIGISKNASDRDFRHVESDAHNIEERRTQATREIPLVQQGFNAIPSGASVRVLDERRDSKYVAIIRNLDVEKDLNSLKSQADEVHAKLKQLETSFGLYPQSAAYLKSDWGKAKADLTQRITDLKAKVEETKPAGVFSSKKEYRASVAAVSALEQDIESIDEQVAAAQERLEQVVPIQDLWRVPQSELTGPKEAVEAAFLKRMEAARDARAIPQELQDKSKKFGEALKAALEPLVARPTY